MFTQNRRKGNYDKTFEGKINMNAFAWCDNMDGLDLTQLYFGTESQIKGHAFFDCEGITELTIGDINDNQLGAGQYTIDKNAFEDCPIATLTLGDINTANAIGSAAFGDDLKDVTIGNVEAGDAAFAAATETAKGAFVFANVSGTTLNLAWNEKETGYLSSESPATKTIIPKGAFDFSAVTGLDKDGKAIANFVFPVINVGELKSQGGIFAEGAIIGKTIDEVNFKGDINTKGLNTHFIATETEPIEAKDAVYEMKQVDKIYDESDADHTAPTGAAVKEDVAEAGAGDFVRTNDGIKKVETAYVAGEEFTYWGAQTGETGEGVAEGAAVIFTEDQVNALGGSFGDGIGEYMEIGDDEYARVFSGSAAEDATFEQEDGDEKKTYTRAEVEAEGGEAGSEEYPASGEADLYWHLLEPAVEAGDQPINELRSVVFEGDIKTKGITNMTNGERPDVAKGPFSNFPNLVTVTFNGMLSENAVDANTFACYCIYVIRKYRAARN